MLLSNLLGWKLISKECSAARSYITVSQQNHWHDTPYSGWTLRNYMMKKPREILKDTSHLLHEFYYVAQSGCRYISERLRTNRYRYTFLPTSVRLLNAISGSRKCSGRMGRYNGAHNFPYNFALSLLIVTTNVVVLCDYLSKACSLWGTIKSYCIVM